MVQDGVEPPRLDPQKSPQCQKCAWRSSCQGKALLEGVAEEGEYVEYDERLAAVAGSCDELGRIVKDATAEPEAEKGRLKALLGERTAVDTAGARIYWRPVTSMRWDANHMAKAYRELVDWVDALYTARSAQPGPVRPGERSISALLVDPTKAYKKPSTSRPLRIYAR
jgi:hypothetical protein